MSNKYKLYSLFCYSHSHKWTTVSCIHLKKRSKIIGLTKSICMNFSNCDSTCNRPLPQAHLTVHELFKTAAQHTRSNFIQFLQKCCHKNHFFFRSLGWLFSVTWGRVNNDRMFNFEWTNPFICNNMRSKDQWDIDYIFAFLVTVLGIIMTSDYGSLGTFCTVLLNRPHCSFRSPNPLMQHM